MSRQLRFILPLLFLALLATPVPGRAAAHRTSSVRVALHSQNLHQEHRQAPARFNRARRERWAGRGHDGFERHRRRSYGNWQVMRPPHPNERRVVVVPLPVPVPRLLLPPPLIIGGLRFW